MGLASQFAKPGLHVNPQVSIAQVGVEFAGGTQAVHEAPHAVTSPGVTQRFPHKREPIGHRVPQVFAEQVAVPPAGTGHTVQSGPQFSGSMFDAHLPPHSWKLFLQVNLHVPPPHVVFAFNVTGHFALQAPQ